MNGWLGGWVNEITGLCIAYSNQGKSMGARLYVTFPTGLDFCVKCITAIALFNDLKLIALQNLLSWLSRHLQILSLGPISE
jgi:hypothetical protein